MRKKSIADYIYFGTDLRYLQDVQQGFRVHGDSYVIANIKGLFEHLEELDLVVTRRIFSPLQEIKNRLEEKPKHYRLTEDDAKEISEFLAKYRDTLLAEAQGRVAFVVSDKRIDVNKLLEGIRDLFAPGAFDELSEIARFDFDEAGKCIAFERPTAAAFHLLRGTEEVLRHFYCANVKQKRAELMWGPMVESLRNRRKPPPVALLDHLDHLRLNFRNPTQHPEKIYDIQEVQDLFALCVDVVIRMVARTK